MKQPMTANEYFDIHHPNGLEVKPGAFFAVMEAYAKTYAREIIESLDNSDVDDFWMDESQNYPYRDGANWAREELLKRIK